MLNRPIVRQLKLPMASVFHQQHIRPITVDTSNSLIINQLADSTMGFRAITPTSLADIAPAIIKPKADSSAVAQIANGWEEKRLRFYMEVELSRSVYSSTYLLITGFTDYAGVTNTGAVDPNMRLYFNNITQYTDSVYTNLNQGFSGTKRTTQNNSQIIQPLINMSSTNFSSRVRPCDVVTNMAIQDLTTNDPFVVNTVGAMSAAAQASRARQLPSAYISNILSASVTASDLVSSHSSIDSAEEAYYKEMVGRLRENGFNSNGFLALLVARTNYANSGSVTWGELASLFPEINENNVTEVQFVRAGHLPDYRMNTEHHRGVGIENQAVAIIQNILPAIMTLNMIHQASFMLTNETVDGQPRYVPSSVVPMTDKIDVGLKMSTFADQILTQLAPALSGGNGFTFNVQISANVLTEMLVNIRMNGGIPIEFAVPLYADSTFSCFGYATRHELDHITHEIQALTNAVAATTGADLGAMQAFYDQENHNYSDPINSNKSEQPSVRSNPMIDPFANQTVMLNTHSVGTNFSDDPFAI